LVKGKGQYKIERRANDRSYLSHSNGFSRV
jgi:hypothetical protein